MQQLNQKLQQNNFSVMKIIFESTLAWLRGERFRQWISSDDITYGRTERGGTKKSGGGGGTRNERRKLKWGRRLYAATITDEIELLRPLFRKLSGEYKGLWFKTDAVNKFICETAVLTTCSSSWWSPSRTGWPGRSWAWPWWTGACSAPQPKVEDKIVRMRIKFKFGCGYFYFFVLWAFKRVKMELFATRGEGNKWSTTPWGFRHPLIFLKEKKSWVRPLYLPPKWETAGCVTLLIALGMRPWNMKTWRCPQKCLEKNIYKNSQKIIRWKKCFELTSFPFQSPNRMWRFSSIRIFLILHMMSYIP